MELTFVSTMWAYLHRMPIRYEHRKMYEGMPGTKSTYGYSEYDDTLGEDYYVGLSEKLGHGPPTGSRDITYGHFYPERVFVWGDGEDRQPIDRKLVLEHMKVLGFRYTSMDFWNPCRPWRGYETGFKPTFYHALRADANIGIRFYDVMSTLSKSTGLPAGYELVENYDNRFTVYIETE